MKKLIFLLLTIFLILTGCSPAGSKGEASVAGDVSGSGSGTGSSDSKGIYGEISFYPAADPDYKTANNIPFDFWFDIPSDWEAEDNSNDGSTFDLLPGNGNVKLQIYGQMKDGSEDEYYKSLAGSGGTVEDFTYRDGWVGKQIKTSDNETYYIRVDGDSYIILHVDAGGDPEWKKKNEDILANVAESARITRESYGMSLSDENKVTPDDLQLGNIKLDMTYDELITAIGKKPEQEEADEHAGVNAKTLYFADSTQVYIVDDKVYSVNVTSSDYATPRGLKAGDSEARLKELYGEPSSNEDGVLGYSYNGYDLFTVVIEGGKVSQIQIDKGSWDVEVF
ncbi:MAG TPA: hypothetical protein VHT96_11190 [Clostridia bacterium]|nr:hypothetical protein [Clostridia bacterium]